MKSVFLKKSLEVFDRCSDVIVEMSQKNLEFLIRVIQAVTAYAWDHHPGRYTDHRLENVLLDVGKRIGPLLENKSIIIPELKPIQFKRKDKRRVLHFATDVDQIGGHTRVIYHWIKNDVSSCHSLLLGSHGEKNEIPKWLVEAIHSSGGNVVVCPETNYNVEQVAWLRQVISVSDIDLVISHHHTYDVFPTIIFADEKLPPLAIFSQGDHDFWLGSSVADIVINFRLAGKAICDKARLSKKSMILPLPMSLHELKVSRSEARKRLNISDEEIVLLSVGSAYKYRPVESFNFFNLISPILKYENIHLYIIGVSESDLIKWKVDSHKRYHLLGVVTHIQDYLAAADLYIEGGPLTSCTALFDAIMSGLCPVLNLGSRAPILRTNDVSYEGILSNPMNEKEYINNLSILLKNKELRNELAEKVTSNFFKYHSGVEWKKYLEELYECAGSIEHEPKILKEVFYEESEDQNGWSEINEQMHYDKYGKDEYKNIDRVLKHKLLWISKYFLKYSKLAEFFQTLAYYKRVWGFKNLFVEILKYYFKFKKTV